MIPWRLETMLSVMFVGLLVSACATTATPTANRQKAVAARNLGEAYLSEGNHTAALGELLKALALDPDDPILHNDLGLVYMVKEKTDMAVVHFEKAVALKPDYSLAKNNLAGAYLVQEAWDQAIPLLDAVTADMLYATPHYPLANLGWAYYNKGNYTRARHYLKEALEIQPDFFTAQLNLGRTYLALGQINAALGMFEAAAENNPQNPMLLLELGKTYRITGDYQSARLALNGTMEYAQDATLALQAAEELKKTYR